MERLTTAYERIGADGSAEMQYVANASDLEVESRLFVVPCKPGDEIYEIVEVEFPEWDCYICGFIVQDVSAKQVKYADEWADWDAPYLYTDEKEARAKAEQLLRQRNRLKSGWIPVTERLPENDDYVLMSFENFSLPLVGRYVDDEKLGGAWYLGIASTKIPVWRTTCSSMPGCRCRSHTGRMSRMMTCDRRKRCSYRKMI